jgi:drug/metabolite transporter (DMT)-like permease
MTSPLQASRYGRGVVAIGIAGVLWSTMGLGVRMIEDASALQILLYRSLGILPVLFLFIAIRSRRRQLSVLRDTGVPAILGGIGLVVAFGGSIISLKTTTVANAVFILSVAPFFAAILARIFLGERVRAITWVTMFVGGIGVAIMVLEGVALGRLVGNVAAFVCALGFAGYTLALRWEEGADPLPVVFLGGVYTTIAAGIAVMVAGQSLLTSPHDAAVAFGLGAVMLSGGLILYSIGSQWVPAGEAALLSLMEVVLSPIWVWLLFGEEVGLMTILGGGILLSALLVNALTGLLSERRADRPSVPYPSGTADVRDQHRPARLGR